MNTAIGLCQTTPPTDTKPQSTLLWRLSALGIWITGVVFRIYPSGSTRLGFDENLYRTYVNMLRMAGLFRYPEIVASYISTQRGLPSSILPPMRFSYIFCGYLWTEISARDTLVALHDVACFFSILSLTLAFVFAVRLAGRATGLAVLALVACAPTQIHMSQHALVDGIFSFWALLVIWMLWENLRQPNHPGWLAAYAAAFAVMVLTKENAFFVFVAVAGILAANRWAGFGRVTPRLLLVTFCGPLAGVLTLVLLAGGPANLLEAYHLSVTKNLVLPYAIHTGDGPWYRYMVDLFLVSPIILILAIGELFKLNAGKKPQLYLLCFITFSYAVMANIKYGMNLRYANMCDMPLRVLAFANVACLAEYFGNRRCLVLVLAVAALCAFDLHQYYVFFDRHSDAGGLYELITEELMRAVKILKLTPPMPK